MAEASFEQGSAIGVELEPGAYSDADLDLSDFDLEAHEELHFTTELEADMAGELADTLLPQQQKATPFAVKLERGLTAAEKKEEPLPRQLLRMEEKLSKLGEVLAATDKVEDTIRLSATVTQNLDRPKPPRAEGAAAEAKQGAVSSVAPSDLNQVLVDKGMAPLPSELARIPEVSEALRSLVVQLNRRELQVQNFALDEHARTETRAERKAKALERDLKASKLAQAAAERRCDWLTQELQTVKADASKKAQGRTSETIKLRNLLKHSEHRVRERENTIEALKGKLAEAIRKEKTLRKRENAVFGKMAFQSTRSLSRTKVSEIVQAYEAHRGRLEQDVDALRAEVSSLNGLLKEKENVILSCSLRDASASLSDLDPQFSSTFEDDLDGTAEGGLEHVEIQRWRDRALRAAREARSGRARERTLRQRLEAAGVEVIQQKKLNVALGEEVQNLRLELQSRPTVSNWQDAQTRIIDLERKLHSAVADLNFKNEEENLRQYLPASETMKRDRANHRLGLERLDALPQAVARELLRAACRELELGDVSELCPSIRKLCAATRGLPRLERFVRTVCGFVFGVEAERDPALHGRRRTMEEVFTVLKHWRGEILAVDDLGTFQRSVTDGLRKPQTPPQAREEQEETAA
mmetsp:Transcript_92/g.327  ORF Transcript_92/g.327 Transcript_92/m.327 type:complete len:639 (-) Transcript_92:8-1924(-)